MSATSSIYSHRPMQPIRGSALSLSSGPAIGGGHLGSGQPIVSGGGNSNAGLGTSVGGVITRTGSRSNSGGPFGISEALDVIRREYDNVAGQMLGLQSEKRELEVKLESQLAELNTVRNALYKLESQHGEIKQQYEDELVRLRAELNSIRHANSEGSSTGAGAVTISRRANSSGPVVSPVTSASMGAPAAMRLSPDQRQPNHGALPTPRDPADSDGDPIRQRERARELERGRDSRMRLGQEREVMSRVTRLPSFKDEVNERDSERLKDNRSSKRHKARQDYQASGTDPDYLAPTAGHRLPLPMTMSSSFSTITVEDLSSSTVSSELRKEDKDWCAVYNPKARKALDVTLVHAFPHTSVVCCVQFSADGKYLATGCNRTAQIYNTRTGEKICVVEDKSVVISGELYIRSVRFSPDGKYLATGAEDKKIRIWEIATRQVRHVFEGHEQEIYSLDFSRDGRYIVSGSGDRTMRIWDLVDPESHRTITIGAAENSKDTSVTTSTTSTTSTTPDAGVTSVAISPDGNWVAAGSLDCIIRMWDLRTGEMVEKLRGHHESVYSVAFTPDGMGLVTGSLDKSLKFWDITHVIQGDGEGEDSTTEETKSFVGHKDFVLSVAVTNDGRWVISGSKDRTVHVWDTFTGALQLMLQGHKNSVISIDINPFDGTTFATGSGDSSARIWSYAPI